MLAPKSYQHSCSGTIEKEAVIFFPFSKCQLKWDSGITASPAPIFNRSAVWLSFHSFSPPPFMILIFCLFPNRSFVIFANGTTLLQTQTLARGKFVKKQGLPPVSVCREL